MINTLTISEWKNILDESKGFCFYCNSLVGINKLTLEHIVPLVKGGENSVSNVAAACLSCNFKKGSKTGRPKDENPSQNALAQRKYRKKNS